MVHTKTRLSSLSWIFWARRERRGTFNENSYDTVLYEGAKRKETVKPYFCERKIIESKRSCETYGKCGKYKV